MEFKRNSVISLYLAGKPQVAIVRELQHLNVNKMFVSRTIKRYNETGSIAIRHGGGQKKTATSLEMVRNVMAEIQSNPRQSAAKLAATLNVSDSSIRRILKNELNLKPYKIQKVHDLTVVLKAVQKYAMENGNEPSATEETSTEKVSKDEDFKKTEDSISTKDEDKIAEKSEEKSVIKFNNTTKKLKNTVAKKSNNSVSKKTEGAIPKKISIKKISKLKKASLTKK